MAPPAGWTRDDDGDFDEPFEFDPQDEDEDAAEFTLAPSEGRAIEEIDLTAMVDVSFQLILFFLVAATAVYLKTLEIPEPNPEKNEAAAVQPRTIEELESDFILVGIDPEGAFTIDHEPVEPSLSAPGLSAPPGPHRVGPHRHAPDGRREGHAPLRRARLRRRQRRRPAHRHRPPRLRPCRRRRPAPASRPAGRRQASDPRTRGCCPFRTASGPQLLLCTSSESDAIRSGSYRAFEERS